jgi:sugar diacid utilization regulator
MGADELTEDALPEPVRRLLHGEPGLLRTAEVYLDRAADTRAVASELAMHRATVYQRLRRIEQVAMIDFADGEQRLAMHLGIKLARLLRLW